jgi:hypothetical protein
MTARFCETVILLRGGFKLSLNTTFESWKELMEHLNSADYPKCFTVNYKPETDQYEIWIGNQSYYNYEKLIELEEKEKEQLRRELKECKKELAFWLENSYKWSQKAKKGEDE